MSDFTANTNTTPQEAQFGDYFALLKPRVMSLVVFTAFVGLMVAPVGVPPVDAFTAILFIAFLAMSYNRAPSSEIFGALAVINFALFLKSDSDVKLIIATIKPYKLDEVREALTEKGVRGMMVSEIKGFGAQSGHTEIYRGAEYAVNFVPKVKIEVAVTADLAERVTETIKETANTGQIGDGKIFVYDLSKVVRIRTGEADNDAL